MWVGSELKEGVETFRLLVVAREEERRVAVGIARLDTTARTCQHADRIRVATRRREAHGRVASYA